MYGNHSAIAWQAYGSMACVCQYMSMGFEPMMQVETASSDMQVVQQQCAALESALKQSAATPPSRRMVRLAIVLTPNELWKACIQGTISQHLCNKSMVGCGSNLHCTMQRYLLT